MNLLIPTKKTFYIHSTYLIQYFYTSIMALCSFLRACLIHKMHRMWIFFSPFNMKLKRCISWTRFNCLLLLLLFIYFLFVCSLCNSRVQVTKKIIMWIQKTHSWSSGYIFCKCCFKLLFSYATTSRALVQTADDDVRILFVVLISFVISAWD